MFIGYLARQSNFEVSQHLLNDGSYNCEVISFLSTSKPDLRVTLYDEGEDGVPFPDETEDA